MSAGWPRPDGLLAALLTAVAVLAVLRPVGGAVRTPPWWPLAAATGTLVAMAALLAVGDLPWRLPLALAAVVPALRALGTRRQRRRDGEGRTEQVREACEVLAGELAAGATPVAALEAAAEGWPELAPVAGGARLGGSVPDAMRRVASLPGAQDLRLVAAAWQLSQRTGAPLARSLDTVAGDLRDRAAMRRTIRSELASARATARLVVALPVLTLGAGSGLGGSPVRYLVGTPMGTGLLVGGAALVLLGTWWLEAIAGSILDRDP